METVTLMALAGLVIGFGFGFVIERTNFCTMGAISDAATFGDFRRFRAWMLAMAVAIVGAQALQAGDLIDLGQSIYLTANFGWFGAIVGGLLFGFGMTIAGGCGTRNLVRFGAGDLRSLVVVLVLGIFAYMTLRGLTGLVRVGLEGATNVDLAAAGVDSQGIGALLGGVFGSSVETMNLIVAAILVLGLSGWCFMDSAFRASARNIVGGLGVGLAIVAGWYATGVLGFDDFEPAPLTSLTYVAPTGNALVYLMTFTGATINFGIASVGGVVLGAFASAVLRRNFHLATFADVQDMLRNITGGALMGFGGVMALGCTIGQGLTGISTLALGSVIAILAIIAGGIAGLKYIEWRL